MDLRETTLPVLHPLVEELLADERLAAFADVLRTPESARVSEPALPLLLAALHEHLGRALVVLLPEDADARDAAEGARWFLGDERVALLPTSLTIFGAATMLGQTPRDVALLIREGALKATRRGRHFHIDRDHIQAYRKTVR